MILANRKMNEVFTRRGMLDDLGLLSMDPASQKKVDEVLAKKRKKKTPAPKVQSIGAVIGSTFFMAPFILGSIFFLTRMEGLAILGFLAVMAARIIWNIVQRNKKAPSEKSITSAPFKDKIGTLWKCLAAFVVVGGVMIIAPVDDLFYYLADIVAILLTGWTVLDIVHSHNLLTARKLPQFGKRGGDEHEY